jgi:hypothetical protein
MGSPNNQWIQKVKATKLKNNQVNQIATATARNKIESNFCRNFKIKLSL